MSIVYVRQSLINGMYTLYLGALFFQFFDRIIYSVFNIVFEFMICFTRRVFEYMSFMSRNNEVKEENLTVP